MNAVRSLYERSERVRLGESDVVEQRGSESEVCKSTLSTLYILHLHM